MPPRLRSVPDAQPRAVGLIRVSKLGERSRDDLVSPEIQRAAIEDHCARRGYALGRWVEGIDESGSQRRSKWWARLDECVGLVEAGDADVLVVWRFDRTSRNRLRWATAIDRVEVAGGLLESATEPLDTSTASGRLARGMLAEMAAYRAEEIGGVWREVHARRTARGLPANGKARFGYRVRDGLHRPDAVEAPILAEMYRRYVAGESIRGLTLWLNRQGVRTVPGYRKHGGGPWSQAGVRRCLDSGFGAGLILVHGEAHRGAHEPVIDNATWEAYRAARAARRPLRRAASSPYLLSGLLRCGELVDGQACGGGMAHGNYKGWVAVRCSRAADTGSHHRRMTGAPKIEEKVHGWLTELAEEVDVSADAAAAQAAHAARRKVDARTLAMEAAEMDKALTRLAANQAVEATAMPAEVFTAARDELLARRNAAEERARIARADATRHEPAVIARGLLEVWGHPDASVESRRQLLRSLIARIVVGPGETIGIVPAWDA